MIATAFAAQPLRDARPAGGGVRILTATIGAAVITVALFFLMRALVWTDAPAPIEKTEPFIVAIGEAVPEVVPSRRVLPEPPSAIAPPPALSPIPVDPSDGHGEAPSAGHLPSIPVEIDPETMNPVVVPPPPLEFRTSPNYPQRELRLGLEGRCVVQYDVLGNGRTANAQVLACDSAGFARASLAAVADWRHAVARGAAAEAVVRRGVQTRLDFTLED